MASQTLTQTQNAPLRQIVNIFALGAVLTINALANILPINGQTTGELSDKYPSLFTPAGYVFSIWGLIYLLLAVFIVYQALPSQKDNPRLERLGYAFAISCIFNFAWIIVWHYELIFLSQVMMLGILATLIMSYERLGIGSSEVPVAERWAVRLAFSIYLGWITVATVANTSVLLISWGFDGGAFAPLWTVIAIVAALGIGLTVLARRGDSPYTLVLVWAFAGIAVKQWGVTPSVVVAAIAAAVVLAIMIGRRQFGPRPTAY